MVMVDNLQNPSTLMSIRSSEVTWLFLIVLLGEGE